MAKGGIKKLFGLGAVAVGASLYLINASWLASPPSGRPTVIAQRGLHQVYGREGVDDETCTAHQIPPPSHMFIDNTLPSIAAAFAMGADVVEVDVKLTKDREFGMSNQWKGLGGRTHARRTADSGCGIWIHSR
jgi:glycerophosphoryl diester phosphodiesterase